MKNSSNVSIKFNSKKLEINGMNSEQRLEFGSMLNQDRCRAKSRICRLKNPNKFSIDSL